MRQGVTSWFVFYLIKAKGVADAGSAAFRVSGLELGGLFGSLLAGRLSDAMIAGDPKAGSVGKRVQVWPLRFFIFFVLRERNVGGGERKTSKKSNTLSFHLSPNALFSPSSASPPPHPTPPHPTPPHPTPPHLP